MLINTQKHISDYADTIIVDTTGTVFDGDKEIENFQDIIQRFNKFSVTGNENATTEKYGLVRLGRNKDDVVTTRRFIDENTKIKSDENKLGVVILRDRSSNNYDNVSEAVTPKVFKDYISNRKYSNNTTGVVKFATKAEIDSKKGNSIVSPKDLTYALDTMIPKDNDADETTFGLVKLVTASNLYGSGKDLDVGHAISPKVFQVSTSTQERRGIGKFASNWENKEDDIITPKSLSSLKIKLRDRERDLQDFDNRVNKIESSFMVDARRIAEEVIERRKNEIFDEIMAIGDITITSDTKDTARLKTMNGQLLDVNKHKRLFDIIGYKYGGEGNSFRIPDARGMMMKMYGRGGLINGDLGNIKSYNIGDFLKQGVAPHKHAGFGYRVFKQTYRRRPIWSWEYLIPEEYRGDDGLWGFGRTSNASFHGSRTNLSKNCVLRYGDTGSQHGRPEFKNEDTRPWNITLNFMMRVL